MALDKRCELARKLHRVAGRDLPRAPRAAGQQVTDATSCRALAVSLEISDTYNKYVTFAVLTWHIECEHGVTRVWRHQHVWSVCAVHVQERDQRRSVRPAGG